MRLRGKKVLMFAGPMVEDIELLYPLHRLREEGAEVVVAGLGERSYEGKKGHRFEVDTDVDRLSARGFDAVVIPGGYAPDHFRRSERLLEIVRETFEEGRPVAAICHAGWVPVSAGIAKGRQMTSFPSIKDDLMNAGAEWVDREVVVDDNLITSRKPDDLGAFCLAIIDALESQA
jgi:protease I